jgi:RNA polymerase sigma factor (sigma-70 family)
MIGRRREVARAEPLDGEADLSDELAQAEGERALARIDLNRALGALTAHERRLIALRYVSDWSHPEIARTLGIPEATARVHLHRAHKHLRPFLSE